MKTTIILLSTFYFLFSIVVAPMAYAEPLVPCGPGSGGPEDCSFCHLTQLGERVMKFGIYTIAIPVGVIFIIYGGFVIMTAGGSTDRVTNGRKILQSAVIGVLIVLASWLIVDQVLTILAQDKNLEEKGFKPWKFYESIEC